MLSLSETESAYVDGAIRPEWARLGYDCAAGRRGGMADLCIGTGEASRLGRMTVITSRIDGAKRSWTTSRRLWPPDSAVHLALQHDKQHLNAAFLGSHLVWSSSATRTNGHVRAHSNAGKRLLRSTKNPFSECAGGSVTDAIVPDDKLIVVGSQFRDRDRTHQAAG
jgi:hypothetical protein